MAEAPSELRFLAAELRKASGRQVLTELRDGLRRAAGPAVQDARRSILGVPARHERDLRQGIAGNVKVATTLGAATARVRITATGPERWRGAAAEFERGRWNHPVFARKPDTHPGGHGRAWTWVKQAEPSQDWFAGTITGHQAEFDRAVERVTDDIERRLSGEA